MNRLFLFILFQLSFSLAFSQESNKVNSTIDAVTVYRQGARMSSVNNNVSIPAGTSEIIMENVPASINAQTLQVALKGDFILLSASCSINYITNTNNPQAKKLTDSIEAITERVDWISQQKEVFEEEQELLKKNQSLQNDKNGFSVQELKNLADLYRNRMLEIRQKVTELSKKELTGTKTLEKLKSQLAEWYTSNNKPTGQINLQVSANQSTNGAIRCSYLVDNAGWVPKYDLRSEGLGKDIKLIYKADVFQSTGFNWDNINLTISTGNPSANNDRPIMYPRYINYVVANYDNSLSEVVARDKKDFGKSMNMAQATGEMKLTSSPAMEEPKPLEATIADNDINIEYELAQKQQILSNGKNHLIAIDEHALPARYQYHTVPKLDAKAFLLAKVSNWGQYNLLAGTANIFFEGAFVGQSTIDPSTVSDTLLISLGRDDKINIKRTKLVDMSKSSSSGSNKEDRYAYETTIRNGKNIAIDIEVLDQIPLSKNQAIKVKLEESIGAVYTEEYGKLLWTMSIPAGQSKKIKLIYSVKYPKEEQVAEGNQ